MLSALDRANDMLTTPMGKLPHAARDYASQLASRLGGCTEVLLTAYCHYAVVVEGLVCSDEAYMPGPDAYQFFNTPLPEKKPGKPLTLSQIVEIAKTRGELLRLRLNIENLEPVLRGMRDEEQVLKKRLAMLWDGELMSEHRELRAELGESAESLFGGT